MRALLLRLLCMPPSTPQIANVVKPAAVAVVPTKLPKPVAAVETSPAEEEEARPKKEKKEKKHKHHHHHSDAE